MPKPMSKQAIYSKISSRANELIERLFELAKSDNPSIALGACKTLLERVAPPVKTLDLFKLAQLDFMQVKYTRDVIDETKRDITYSQATDEEITKLLKDQI